MVVVLHRRFFIMRVGGSSDVLPAALALVACSVANPRRRQRWAREQSIARRLLSLKETVSHGRLVLFVCGKETKGHGCWPSSRKTPGPHDSHMRSVLSEKETVSFARQTLFVNEEDSRGRSRWTGSSNAPGPSDSHMRDVSGTEKRVSYASQTLFVNETESEGHG